MSDIADDEALELAWLDKHFKRRVVADLQVKEMLGQQPTMPRSSMTLEEQNEAAKEWLRFATALRDAGKYSEGEHFLNKAMALEHIHENRWMAKAYDDELGPLSDSIRAIEKAHGLKDDEFWLRGEGPVEKQRLSEEYEAILDRKQIEVFREFGENEMASLLENDPARFDLLREAGRVALYARDDEEAHLKEMIEQCEREAASAEKADAPYAACLMLASALEGQLLLKCIREPAKAETARSNLPAQHRPQGSDPRAWGLFDLLTVSEAAGWGDSMHREFGNQLRAFRNLVHPGRHLKLRNRSFLDRESVLDAKAAYIVIRIELGGHRGPAPLV